MFREGTEADTEGMLHPILTTGSIVWGILLRSTIILFGGAFIVRVFEMYNFWWTFLFIFWIFVAYPGWRQFQKFKERIKKLEESTLCGSCVHFESTGQLCKIYDEHISNSYIPCEGLSWEPRSYEDKN
jgi:hypothetical protein